MLFGMLVVKFIPSSSRQQGTHSNSGDAAESEIRNDNAFGDAKNGKITTVDSLGIQPLVLKKQGLATALAPESWSMTATERGTVDLYSPDHNEYAGAGVFAVNRQMQSYYGNMYGAPEESILTLISSVLKQIGSSGDAQYTTDPKPFGSFLTVRDFEDSGKQGRVFYQTYGDTSSTYTESVYMACTDKNLWDSHKELLTNMALSIRPHASLQISSEALSGSRDNQSNNNDEESNPLKDYNAQLGTQWFHDDLGNRYNVDPNQATVNGPQGEGVYKVNGNDVTKLTPGF